MGKEVVDMTISKKMCWDMNVGRRNHNFVCWN